MRIRAYLIFILFFGCSTEDSNVDRILKIGDEGIIIKGKAVPLGAMMNRKVKVECIDDFLLIVDGMAHENGILHIYDLSDGRYCGNMIPKGEGPLELSTISSIFVKNDSIYLFDLQTRKILKSPWQQKACEDILSMTFENESFDIEQSLTYPLLHLLNLPGRGFLASRIIGPDGRFVVLNNDKDSLYTFGPYPEIGFRPKEHLHPIDYQINVLFSIYNLKPFINPFTSDLIVLYNSHLIELFDTQTGALKSRLIGPQKDFPIKNVVHNQNGTYSLPKDHQRAYGSAKFSNKHMFVSYNGRAFNGFEESLLSTKILVFTHEGDYLYTLIPGLDFFAFTVNEAGTKLFIIRSYEEDEAYVEFDLSDVG